MKKLLLTLIAIIPFIAFAQTNYTGTWQLNKEKSNFGNIAPETAAASRIAISQTKETFNLERTLGIGNIRKETYTLDGKPFQSNVDANTQKTSSIKWDGNTKAFIITSNYKVTSPNQYEYNRTENWKVSADQKTLTVERTTVLPDRTETTNAVYDKQ